MEINWGNFVVGMMMIDYHRWATFLDKIFFSLLAIVDLLNCLLNLFVDFAVKLVINN